MVIGGLVSDDYQDQTTKVPWLGDIPVLGWAFKSTSRELRKTNLIVFLTPHIVRSPLDLEHESIRKREEFREKTGESLEVAESTLREEEQRYAAASEAGEPYYAESTGRPVRSQITEHTVRYPVDRMRQIEQERAEELARLERERAATSREPQFFLQAAIFGDADAAAALLTDLIDSGHDGTLLAQETAGSVLYELHLGPYASLDEAQGAASVVRRSHGLVPTVIVLEPGTGDAGESTP